MTAGRPTKYKSEYCDLVIEKMSQGYSKEAVAGFIGIAKDTLYNWIKAHKEFSDAIKRGEMLSQVFWEELGLVGTTEGKNFNATAWIFNMKNRFNWRDKQDITSDDKPLPASVVVQLPSNGREKGN